LTVLGQEDRFMSIDCDHRAQAQAAMRWAVAATSERERLEWCVLRWHGTISRQRMQRCPAQGAPRCFVNCTLITTGILKPLREHGLALTTSMVLR
jgi:hypothetical protein